LECEVHAESGRSCNLQGRCVVLHESRSRASAPDSSDPLEFGDSPPLAYPVLPCKCEPNRREDVAVDLSLWIPLTLGLGLVTLLLMYAFAEACARI
jgi:hypothetical protein